MVAVGYSGVGAWRFRGAGCKRLFRSLAVLGQPNTATSGREAGCSGSGICPAQERKDKGPHIAVLGEAFDEPERS